MAFVIKNVSSHKGEAVVNGKFIILSPGEFTSVQAQPSSISSNLKVFHTNNSSGDQGKHFVPLKKPKSDKGSSSGLTINNEGSSADAVTLE